MASIQGTALVGAPINLTGVLYNKTRVDTPLFNAIGSRNVQSRKFITGATYDLGYPQSVLDGITETASLTAPDPHYWERENAENVTQIFQEAVAVSYRKMSNGDDLMAYAEDEDGDWSVEAGQPALVGNTNNVPNELAWQLGNTMDKIKLDIENSILNSSYSDSLGDPGAKDCTRGILEATASGAIAASGSELTFELIYDVAQTIMMSGTPFGMDSYLFVVNYTQFKQLQKIVADEGLKISQSAAGVNVIDIITPFGIMHFLPHRFMPAGKACVICMPVMKNVFQPVPGKGNFFYEPLAKTGAAEKGQVYGQWGLDYGPVFLHQQITGLAQTTAPFTAPKRVVSGVELPDAIEVTLSEGTEVALAAGAEVALAAGAEVALASGTEVLIANTTANPVNTKEVASE